MRMQKHKYSHDVTFDSFDMINPEGLEDTMNRIKSTSFKGPQTAIPRMMKHNTYSEGHSKLVSRVQTNESEHRGRLEGPSSKPKWQDGHLEAKEHARLTKTKSLNA